MSALPPQDSPRRILVDHSGEKGLGDIVCELGLYPALRRRYPGAELASRQSRTLAWGTPEIDAFDETSQDHAFDLVLRQADLRPVTATLQEALQAGRSVFDNFLRFHGFAPEPVPPRLYVLPREVAALGLEDDGSDDLVIAFSADSKEPDRRWGQERFAALAAYLESAHGATLVELGSGLSAGHLGFGLDLVGQTNLRETMAVLSLVDLFVGNHGGLTHIAGAVGTPVLAPWGASHPYAAYAYDAISVGVESGPACRHCGWHGAILPDCLAADLQAGRVPCTQAIAVSDMQRAADALLPRLRAERDRLRHARRERQAAARDPLTLGRFDRKTEVTPFSHQHLYLGGPPGWGRDHRSDNFARLAQVVAFPDWFNRPAEWKRKVDAFIEAHEATSPWVLTLTAHPLTGPEVWAVMDDYLLRERPPGKAIPKIRIILGALSPDERHYLAERAVTRGAREATP